MPALDDVVTGLFATDGGPCVEVAHDEVFLVEFKDNGKQSGAAGRAAAVEPRAGDAPRDGRAAPRPRPGEGGQGHLQAQGRDEAQALQGRQEEPEGRSDPGRDAHAAVRQSQVEHLVSVDGDGRGGLIVGARLLRKQSDPDGRTLADRRPPGCRLRTRPTPPLSSPTP